MAANVASQIREWIGVLTFLVLLAWLGALAWVGFGSPVLALTLLAAFAALRFLAWKKSPQAWRWPTLLGASGLALFVSYGLLRPKSDREWIFDCARQPWAEISGDSVTLHNYRNFEWRADGTANERWESKTLRLSQLKAVDFLISYWGSPNIGHTMLSFDFGEDGFVAASIETRREVGESYHPVAGMLRKYELLYVLGDERDVLRLRTHIRKNDLYLFRLTASPEQSRALFLSYLDTANALRETPAWYNTLTTNCTTSIRQHELKLSEGKPWSWRLVANGHLPAYLYANGYVDRSLPLEELVARSAIHNDARSAPEDAYSTAIRQGRPGF